MQIVETLIEKAKAFHGEACPGIIMGTRMTLAGLREVGLDPLNPGRDLIVFVEIDRCATDAVQAITGCSLGHRSIKFMNFGKFAVSFLNTATGKAVRVAAIPKDKVNKGETDFKKIGEMLRTIPEEEIFTITDVEITLPEEEIPGSPLYKTRCESCGEDIMDKKEVLSGGKILCRNCAGKSYYLIKT